MADNNTNVEVLTIKVGGQDVAIDSLKKLKQAKKDLTDASLRGDQDAIRSLGILKDKLEDVGEAANTAKGSGVEKLTSSFNLLFDGFRNFDGDKIKTAFKGIGSAMSAIPIILLIEGIKALFDNFDKLVALFDTSAKAIKENERAFIDLSNATDLNKVSTDALILVKEQELRILQEENASLGQISAKLKEINGLKQGQITGELQKADKAIQNILFRLGKAKEDIANKSETESLLQFFGFSVGTTEEEVKAIEDELTKAVTSRGEIYNKSIAQTIAFEDKERELRNAAAKKAKDERDKLNKDILGSLDASDPELAAEIARLDAKQKLNDDYNTRKEQIQRDQVKATADIVRAETEADKKAAEEKQKLDAETAQAKLQVDRAAFSAAQGLSDLYFQTQVNAAQGNSAKLLEIQKKKFQVDKAINAANATINGFVAVTSALTLPPPYGEIAAVAVGIAAAANVAKILATKFDGGVTGVSALTGSTGGTGSVSSPPPPPPQISTQQQQTTIINNNGSNAAGGQVYVVETQARDVAGRVARLEAQAKF